jgi:hypothetical protein
MSGITFPVLYNDCYGGFSHSIKAVEEYNKRLPAGSTLLDVEDELEYEREEIRRDDPLMVQICKELGAEASGRFAKIAIKELPLKFKKHFLIMEHDGLENVKIDFPGYQLARIRSILNDESLSSEVKVKMSQDALDEQPERRRDL